MKTSRLMAVPITALAVGAPLTLSAEETVSGTATVRVNNAFTLAVTNGFNFGSLRVSQPQAQTAVPASITLDPQGNLQSPIPGDNGAIITSVDATGAQAAVLTVNNAAPSTNLRISVDSGQVDLNGTAAGTVLRLNPPSPIDTEDYFEIATEVTNTEVNGNNINTDGNNLLTDNTGALEIRLGAKLNYNLAATSNPNNVVYTGNFTVTLQY